MRAQQEQDAQLQGEIDGGESREEGELMDVDSDSDMELFNPPLLAGARRAMVRQTALH
jgi:hypothetical protein